MKIPFPVNNSGLSLLSGLFLSEKAHTHICQKPPRPWINQQRQRVFPGITRIPCIAIFEQYSLTGLYDCKCSYRLPYFFYLLNLGIGYPRASASVLRPRPLHRHPLKSSGCIYSLCFLCSALPTLAHL